MEAGTLSLDGGTRNFAQSLKYRAGADIFAAGLVFFKLDFSLAVNFTNILRAAFLYENVFCAAFMCLQFGFRPGWPGGGAAG